MNQKIEIDAGKLHDLVYTWVRHIGIKRMAEDMDEESFKRGAFVFLDKLHEVMEEVKGGEKE